MTDHERAVKNLQDFIDKNPKAKLRQAAIDKRLALCKSASERLVVVTKMMWKSFYRMDKALRGEGVSAEIIEIKPKGRLT